MFSKIFFITMVAAAMAAPQGFEHQRDFVPILRESRSGPLDGVYDFAFETADGLTRNEQGSPSASNGAVVQQGGWSFTFPDGTPGQVSFVADEGGYRVESNLLPVGPAIPQHALDQIAFAREQAAAGVRWDHQGFRI